MWLIGRFADSIPLKRNSGNKIAKQRINLSYTVERVSQVAQQVKNHLQSRRCGQTVSSPGQEDPLEEEMATHSSILAWKIPWTKEPGGLQATRLQSQTWLKQLDVHTCRGKQQGQSSWSWVRAGRVLGYELREVDWSQIRRNFLSHLKWPCKSLAVGPFQYSDLLLWDPSLLTSLTTGPLSSPLCSRGHVPMT